MQLPTTTCHAYVNKLEPLSGFLYDVLGFKVGYNII